MKSQGCLVVALILGFFMLRTDAPAMAAPLQQTASLQRAAEEPVKRSIFPAADQITQQLQALVTGDAAVEIEPQETFGTRALGVVLSFLKVIEAEGTGAIADFSLSPQTVAWFQKQKTDPVLIERWTSIAQNLLIILMGSFAAGWLADLFLLPLRRKVTGSQPESFVARLMALGGWFLLALVPVLLFLGTALLLLDQSDPQKIVRYVVMTVVYALVVLRLVRLVVRLLLAPRAPQLRLIPLSTEQAQYAEHWLSVFSFVMVMGYFAVDVAQLMQMPAPAITYFTNLVGFVVIVLTIIVIVQKRAFVSHFLAGDLSPSSARHSFGKSMRLWFSRSWHVIAIGYLVVGYGFTALGTGVDFWSMQKGTVLTILVILMSRLSLFLVAKIKNPPKDELTYASGIYRPVLRVLLRLVVVALALLGIIAAWGGNVSAIIGSAWGQRVLGSAFSITTTLLGVVFVYELIHAAIEKRLNKRDAEGNIIEANQRARTLLPMIRNGAIIVLSVVAGMVTLSEMGINIAPLLAGAGVLGVAVGFGSQTLVKDFLTGLFIIMENTIAVGDVVSLGDNTGEVESINIRTVRLRDWNGALHIIPFSEITRIVNKTKGFSYAIIDLGVAYGSDLRKVMRVMQDVGDEIEQDTEFKELIVEPFKLLGVENLGDFSITVRGRIKTLPGKQYDVRRGYMLRVKEKFDAEHIEIPFPTVTHIQKPQEA